MFKDVVQLISQTFTEDDLGQRIPVDTKRYVYTSKRSISQNEFFNSANSGIKAEYVFIVRTIDYNNELLLDYNGRVLDVYRTYEKGEYTELYVRSKLGVK